MGLSRLTKTRIKEFMFRNFKKGEKQVIGKAHYEFEVSKEALQPIWESVVELSKSGVKPFDLRSEAKMYKGRKRQFFKFNTDNLSINNRKEV